MYGLTPTQLKTIRESKAKDKNSFARGFIGTELYRELGLAKINFNKL